MSIKPSSDPIDAVYLYMGILEAYEVVGRELIGEEIQEHVLPRMVYYVRNFLPEIFEVKDDKDIVEELRDFLDNLKGKVKKSKQDPSTITFSMNEIWELRAAIFGFENVFLDILGENVIRNYVFKRLADILATYLPNVFRRGELSLKKKLDRFTSYIKEKDFVKYTNYRIMDNEVEFSANYCAFAKIHNSEAYLNSEVKFCPWGMMANAILAAHKGGESSIKSCTFTTRGSITYLKMVD